MGSIALNCGNNIQSLGLQGDEAEKKAIKRASQGRLSRTDLTSTELKSADEEDGVKRVSPLSEKCMEPILSDQSDDSVQDVPMHNIPMQDD